MACTPPRAGGLSGGHGAAPAALQDRGRPPRINARTVDFDRMEVQTGDDVPVPFSFSTTRPPENRAVCWLTYTNEETHRIIRENLDRSPIYTGVIEGVGPRYCPPSRRKIVRFPDKPRTSCLWSPWGWIRRNCI